MMMVVVPSVAQGQNAQDEAVAAIVAGGEISRADDVADRVHGVCDEVEHDGTETQSHDQAAPSAYEPAQAGQDQPRHMTTFFEETDFRELAEIPNGFPVGPHDAKRVRPQEMRPQEAML